MVGVSPIGEVGEVGDPAFIFYAAAELLALSFTFRQGDRRIIAAMARVVALVHAPKTQSCLEVLRVFIVCGSAIALIAAGRALPF